MRQHVCPNCNSKSSILHGNKVRCGCGVWSDMNGNRFIPTEKPLQHPRDMIPLSAVSDGIHATYTELARTVFNFTTPDEKTVEYTIEDRDGVFVIFSRAYPINKDGSGQAINYVAEKNSMEEAEELVSRLKKL